jgi:hypothetical protein
MFASSEASAACLVFNVRLFNALRESRQSASGQLKPQAEWPISAKAGSESDRRKTTQSGCKIRIIFRRR